MATRGSAEVVAHGDRSVSASARVRFAVIVLAAVFRADATLWWLVLVGGAASAAYVYFVHGREAVVLTSDGLGYRTATGTVYGVPWAEIREIRLLEGMSFPEWRPRPGFGSDRRYPRVVVVTKQPRIGGSSRVELGRLALRRRRTIDAARKALAEVAARHGVRFVDDYE